MVRPRRFSSGSRSASTPVSALTRTVLPWSICPAVATIIGAELHRDRGAGHSYAIAIVHDAERAAMPCRHPPPQPSPTKEIGRTSCRERVCKYVTIPVAPVTLKKKQKEET